MNADITAESITETKDTADADNVTLSQCVELAALAVLERYREKYLTPPIMKNDIEMIALSISNTFSRMLDDA